MMLRIRFFFLLTLLLTPLVYAEEGMDAITTRICFGRLHPECFLLEERTTNGKKEYALALTLRGRVAEERVLLIGEHKQLVAAIHTFQSVAKPGDQLCSSPVRLEQFKGEELIDAQVYCAKKAQSEGLRSKLKNEYF